MPVISIPSPVLFSEPALTILFTANKCPSKLDSKVPNKDPPFCSFVSFLIVLVTPFSKILEYSRLERFSLFHSFLRLNS